jgi:hypothetical protein
MLHIYVCWRNKLLDCVGFEGHLLSHWFLAQLIFLYPEDGGDMFLRNVSPLSMDSMALYPRRWYSSNYYMDY